VVFRLPVACLSRKSIFNKNLLDMVKNTVFSIKKRLKKPLLLPENVKIDFRACLSAGQTGAFRGFYTN
jgi:hypothetical protein